MDNPYKSPQSNIESGIIEPKSKKGWKVYFWIALFVQALGASTVFFMPEQHDAIDNAITFVFYPITLIGLYCFAYNKRFFTEGFWKMWLLIALVVDVFALSGMLSLDELRALNESEMYFSIAFVLVLIAPLMIFQYIGLYNFGFKSPAIWAKQSGEKLE